MNYTQMTIFGFVFIFLSTSLGAAFVFCFKREISAKAQSVFTGFASGIMLAASVFSLLLPALEQTEKEYGRYAFIPIAVGFLSGAVFILLFDFLFFKRMKKSGKEIKLFLAVTLHNIPEGLAVGFSFGIAYALKTNAAYISALLLAIGIGIQNFPEGAAVALPLKEPLHSRTKAFWAGLSSGAIEPVFAILGFYCVATLQFLQPWLLAFSAGTMVFVVVEDLLPDMQERTLGSCFFILGFALMMSLDIAFG
jgi:ZIP family zinc transporter